MIREFRLWNYNKTEFVDMNTDHCFATNPENLGIERKLETVESDVGHYIQNDKINHVPITFDLIFGIGSNAYNSWQVFSDFTKEHKDLLLEYKVDEPIYRRVRLQRLSKTEKDTFNVLRSKLVLLPITDWFVDKTYEINPNDPYVITTSTDDALFRVSMASASAVSNITITLTNGTYQRVIATKPGFELFSASLSIDGIERKVRYYPDGGGVVNGYDLLDLTQSTFPRLPVGETTLEINASGPLSLADVTIREWV